MAVVFLALSLFDNYRTCAVTEKYAACSVRIVYLTCQTFAGYNQHRLVGIVCKEVSCNVNRCYKACAGGIYVHAGTGLCADEVLYKAGCVRIIEIGRAGRNDDAVYILVVIHSSVVSMNFVNISLVTTVSGVYSPVPSIVIPFIPFSFRAAFLTAVYYILIVDFILFLLYNKSVTADFIVRRA